MENVEMQLICEACQQKFSERKIKILSKFCAEVDRIDDDDADILAYLNRRYKYAIDKGMTRANAYEYTINHLVYSDEYEK